MNDSDWKKQIKFKIFINSLKQDSLADSLKGVASYFLRQILYIFIHHITNFY